MASGTSTLLLGVALALWAPSALALGNEGPAPTAVFAAAPANAWDAYDTVQSLRSKHSEVIHQGAPATETTLQNIRADLSAALTWLDTPIVRDMANGNTYLKFRRFDLLRDQAHLLSRLGQPEAAVRNLEAMTDMMWLPPQFFENPDFAALIEREDAARVRDRAAVSLHLSEDSSLATPYVDVLSEAERIAGLSRIWSVARDEFAWFDQVPELDWDRAYLDAIPKVMAATDTAEYYRELQRFVALLQDGHSNVNPPEELISKVYARPGLQTRLLENRVVVSAVFDAALAAAGVVAGEIVLSIDGEPTEEYAQRRIAPFVSSSTPQDRSVRLYDYLLLAGPADAPVKLELQRADGSTHVVQAVRDGYDTLPQPDSEWFTLRPDGIAVLRASQFETPAAEELIEKHAEALLSAQGLVIDIRSNGGGSTENGLKVLTWLSAGPLPSVRSLTRIDQGFERARGASVMWRTLPEDRVGQDERESHYGGPVALLIDAATFSAAEDTAAVFKLMRRGSIIGEASGGSTGQPYSFPLPGGGSARICVKRESYPDGTDFVGSGVLPDIKVEGTLAELRDGRDPVMAAAIAVLQRSK